MESQCGNCGRMFLSVPSEKAKYCSKQCFNAFRLRERMTTCQECGVKFPSRKGRPRSRCTACFLVEKHGECNTRLYAIWRDMKARCVITTHQNWKYYGGRGIAVCSEWRVSFTVFRDWALANGYQSHLTIDRIEVNGNYEPSNCRWATKKQQTKNKRPFVRRTTTQLAEAEAAKAFS